MFSIFKQPTHTGQSKQPTGIDNKEVAVHRQPKGHAERKQKAALKVGAALGVTNAFWLAVTCFLRPSAHGTPRGEI